jgi:hypothetical protein
MGYITITGDSDGDLHTAAMHNSKFGAIASVINGNITHDNLSFPNSEFVINSSASQGGSGWIELDGATSSTVIGVASNSTNGRVNCHVGSIMRLPAAMIIKENIRVAIVKSSTGFASNLTFYFQKCATLTGTWSQIGDAISKDCSSTSSFELDEVVITNTLGQQVAANSYVRLVIVNGSSGAATHPPSSTLNARFSAPHIS